VQAWEKFRLVEQDNCTYAVQTVNGWYLGMDHTGNVVGSTGISDSNAASKFKLIMMLNQ